MIIYTNNEIRKTEYSHLDKEFETLIEITNSIFKPSCTVYGISQYTDNSYSIYVTEKPTNSPIDLSEVILDPLCNNLLSFKIKNGMVTDAKVYKSGNINNVERDKPVIATGVFVIEDAFTVYYQKDNSQSPQTPMALMTGGCLSTTYYTSNDTVSAESEYTRKSNVPS